ncbi:MAG: peroxisomal assembly protein [Geoglossum simile]|nr:MAG: peroxisomal assembly protein [Geoglossum simile]
MAELHSDIHRRKRRRRRRPDRPAISAGLLLNEQLKGDIGVLSEDLWVELFPKHGGQDGDCIDGNPDQGEQGIRHVAISPWMPLSSSSTEDASWTILPVRSPSHEQSQSKHLAHSTVQFPAASLSLQTFSRVYESLNLNKNLGKNKSTIEIRVLDVVPLGLDTVFISIDVELVKALDQSNGSIYSGFGGPRLNGFASLGGKGKGKTAAYSSPTDRLFSKTGSSTDANDSRLRGIIREAISNPKVVHSGDLLPLPLPSHPITHAPPPPAKVTFCEPVSQGLLLPGTKIVVTRTQHHLRPSRVTPTISVHRFANRVPEEEEDTSDDRFYSANEGYGSSTLAPSSEEQEDGVTTTDVSESEENDYLSDDSLDDIISLSAPLFPPQTPSVLSAFQPGTPHGIAGGRHTNGVNTPGSVFSSYTSRTARASGSAGSSFKVQELLERIPDTLLHPKPLGNEDDEARVFVDVSALVKVGCFSGDWIMLEGSSAPGSGMLGIWGLGALESTQEQKREWRAAKVYGLPESYSGRRPGVVRRAPRQRSDAEPLAIPKDAPKVYLSPLLHGNLHAPTHLRLSPLAPGSQVQTPLYSLNSKRDQVSSLSSPPSAKEVTLLKVSTPLATDRALQPSILTGLKKFLERRRRTVKENDWIGVSFDESLGRTLYQASKGHEDEAAGDELLSGPPPCVADEASSDETKKTGVAWFKVGNVVVDEPEAIGGSEEEGDIWGGVVAIDPTSTRVVQAGSEKSKSLGTLGSSWEYYLGLKKPPSDSTGLAMRNGISGMPQPRTTLLRRRLRELISVATSPRAIHLGLQPIAILVTSTQRNIGKATVATRACADLGIHAFPIDAYDILTDGGAGGGDVKAEALLKARCERAMSCGPEFCALIIRHIEALTADRIASALRDVVAESRVFIATTTEVEKVPEGVRGLFTHELEMSAPDEGEREDILRDVIEDKCVKVASDVDLASVAVKTAALVAGDLVDVVDRAMVARTERIELVADNADRKRTDIAEVNVRDVLVSGGETSRCVTKSDFDIAVDHARKNFADAIGAPKIPNVSWDDVGGLKNVKDAVMETIQLPLERPELFAKGMKKRSGILFYGPPGTGKTLLAKAIATEFSLNFFSIKGPELLNMYIGESEANVRRVFQRARDARPCVVFFDELDSVAPKRGNQGDSGGVMDRIVSQLLAELDGMSDGEDGGGVFVIGATNRPDLLDQALLRPGRFDKMLYLGISDTHDKQLTILEALTRKFTLHPTLSLRRVAESLPFTYTGADLYALCSDAMLKAITRQANAVDRKIKALPSGPVTTAYFFDHLATTEDTAVMVTEADFFEAKRELVGSVSAKELEHYERVRKGFEATDEKQSAKHPTHSFQPPLRNAEAASSGSATRINGKNRVFSARKGKARAPASGAGWDTPDGDISDHQDNDEEGGYRDDDDDDEEDEHIIRTEHLTINGASAAGFGGERKGKGKEKGGGGLFEDPSGGDEKELYG